MGYKEQLNYYSFRDTVKVNNLGHLEIAGVDTVDLAMKYGTPLIVYDIETIKKNINNFKEALSVYKGKTEISYASKAFSSVALFQIMERENISIDVVSGGELYVAEQAGFPGKRINFHGNNKSVQELEEALEYNLGYIIVDNFYELETLSELAEKRQQKVDIIIRITPGITADTHRYIITGNTDSKFGFDLQSGQAEQAIRKAMDCSYLNLDGIHMHIGSQIFGTESYVYAMEQILKYVKHWTENFDFEMKIFNIGGGFGIQHTTDDEAVSPKKQLETISKELMRLLEEFELPIPELWIEPGRSIVGPAGTTIYKLGSQKILDGIRHYISVDGGMADNIRPALYDAKYFASLANRMYDKPTQEVSIAGKACESGDMLIHDISLPEVHAGDLLAMFNTGDYTFSMAGNYNRLPRPAVVFVENGEDFLAIRRETPEDFMRFEIFLPDKSNI